LLKQISAECPDDQITFAELLLQSHSVASFLDTVGFKHGDIAGVVVPNCWHFLAVYLGASMQGGCISGANALLTESWKTFLIKFPENFSGIVASIYGGKVQSCFLCRHSIGQNARGHAELSAFEGEYPLLIQRYAIFSMWCLCQPNSQLVPWPICLQTSSTGQTLFRLDQIFKGPCQKLMSPVTWPICPFQGGNEKNN